LEELARPEAKERALRWWARSTRADLRQTAFERRSLHIEARKQIGHCECDTVMVAKLKGAVVTMVERKSGCAVIAEVSKKASELVSSVIMSNLKPILPSG